MWSLLSQHMGFSGRILVFHWWFLTWSWGGARPPWEARQNNCTQVPEFSPSSGSRPSHSSVCDGSVGTKQNFLMLLHVSGWSRWDKKGADLVQFAHTQPAQLREGPAGSSLKYVISVSMVQNLLGPFFTTICISSNTH